MSGETLWQMVSAILGVMGGLVVLIAMIGVMRLPDVFCRAHALGKGLTLGLGLVMLSLWMHMGVANAGLKIVAAIIFQFITLPVASHLLARLSLEKDIWRAGREEIDEDPRLRS